MDEVKRGSATAHRESPANQLTNDYYITPIPDEIRAYIDQGLKIFPCMPSGKKPAIRDWRDAASCEIEQIERWIEEHPGCNWGLPTGLANGIDVLDVDGDAGKESLAKLIDDHGDFSTMEQVTGSGGRHLLFKHVPGMRNSASKLGQGLDVRGDGGYILVSPSIHPETQKPYTWVNHQLHLESVLEWPPAILNDLRNAAKEKDHVDVTAPLFEGGRNDALFRHASGLRSRGVGFDAILTDLRDQNQRRCQPPLADDEVLSIASSVFERYEPTSPLLSASTTDMGNGERFAHLHGDKARWIESESRWFIYDGARWNANLSRRPHQLAKDTIIKLQRAASDLDPQDSRRQDLLLHGLKSESNRALEAVLNQAKTELDTMIDEFDRDPWLLNCANGTVDLRTGELRPHNPSDYITKTTGVYYVPGSRSRDWENFLETTTAGRPGLSEFLQLAVGYSLTGSTQEEKLFMVLGARRNGKTTFLEAVKAAMGDYAMTADFHSFVKANRDGARGDLARLRGARFVSASETGEGKRLDTGRFKELTGGDTLTVRQLYKSEESFTPELKLWLSANEEPQIPAGDYAIWERVLHIPFTNVVAREDRDLTLKDRLKHEPHNLQAILAWAVEGCVAWQAKGLVIPDSVTTATAKLKEDSSALKAFIDEVLTQGPDHRIAVESMIQIYNRWAKENYEDMMGRRKFNQEMEQLGYERKKDSQAGGKWFWKGIGIKEAAPSNVSAFDRMIN